MKIFHVGKKLYLIITFVICILCIIKLFIGYTRPWVWKYFNLYWYLIYSWIILSSIILITKSIKISKDKKLKLRSGLKLILGLLVIIFSSKIMHFIFLFLFGDV